MDIVGQTYRTKAIRPDLKKPTIVEFLRDGEVISGFPAMKNKSWLRSSSVFKKLPELAKKLRQLDKK